MTRRWSLWMFLVLCPLAAVALGLRALSYDYRPRDSDELSFNVELDFSSKIIIMGVFLAAGICAMATYVLDL